MSTKDEESDNPKAEIEKSDTPPRKPRRRAEVTSDPDARPSMRSRTVAGFLVLIVLLALILADAFGPAFGYNIHFPPSAYPLVAAAVIFWFNIRLSDINRRD